MPATCADWACNRWIWTRTAQWRVGKFNQIDPELHDRHHDAIEFPDGSHVLVTQLREAQRVTVLQLPVAQTAGERAPKAVEASAADSIVTG